MVRTLSFCSLLASSSFLSSWGHTRFETYFLSSLFMPWVCVFLILEPLDSIPFKKLFTLSTVHHKSKLITVEFKQACPSDLPKKIFEMQMPRPAPKSLGMQAENLNSGKTSLSEVDPQAQVSTTAVQSHRQHGDSREPKGRKAMGRLGEWLQEDQKASKLPVYTADKGRERGPENDQGGREVSPRQQNPKRRLVWSVKDVQKGGTI